MDRCTDFLVIQVLKNYLNPLVGKKTRFVKKQHNIYKKKIEELEVPPGREIKSFDVKTLFTSIPVTEAVSVIKN